MTVKARGAIALLLTFGWGCDYTPDLPPGRPSPTPTTAIGPGAVPVIVLPVPTQTPVAGAPSPVPRPVPPDPSFGPVRIVATTPEPGETITVSRDPSVRTRRPIIDFEFTSPQSLTLDNAHTNIELVLLTRGVGCLATDLGYATRLDRNDTVYVANSVARFRTGPWVWRLTPDRCGGSSFSTEYIFYAVGRTDADQAYDGNIVMGWNFLAR